MNLTQSFLIALDMLRLHKLRAFLTMLGVIIGVMSVTLIVMLSEGFRQYLDTEFKKIGVDTIFIMYSPGQRFRGQTTGGIEGLRMSDIDFLTARARTIDIASGFNQFQGQSIRYGDREVTDAEVNAIDSNFMALNRFEVESGRIIDENDVRFRNNVALIGKEIAERLFPNEDPLGKRVSLKGITLEVVGVLKTIEMFGQSSKRDVMIPLSTAQDKWMGGDNLMMIMMRPKDGFTVDQTMDEVWQIMMQRSNNRPIYRIDSRESILNVMGGIIGVAGAILGAIAALSLLVGGIGIMNIMLVSVTERTREIGLRKAVGAKRPAILTQFLVESAVLSLAGGAIGMMIGWMIGQVVSLSTAQMNLLGPGQGFNVAFPLFSAMMALAFSAFVGIVFGIYPAWSASRMDPIVALRSE
jgi:putative ABC transport system permease protein